MKKKKKKNNVHIGIVTNVASAYALSVSLPYRAQRGNTYHHDQ